MREARLAVWNGIFSSDEMPEGDEEYLRRIYESSLFEQRAEGLTLVQLVRGMLVACGEEAEDDISDFTDGTSVADLFYEALLARIHSRTDEEPSEGRGQDDEGDEEQSEESFSPVDAIPVMLGLDTLYQMVRHGQLDLNPPWQRNVVWSPAKQKELVKSILLGIPIPSIILHWQNAGQLGQERFSIIDGKQRLTAIARFLQNEFKLPNYAVDTGHPLHQARGCYYDAEGRGRKKLPASYRTKITMTQIPVLQFRNVSEKRLREVFNLYNVTAVRLNAAEIRNAVYQNNPMHQMLFILAGENPKGPLLGYLSEAEQVDFRQALHRVLPNVSRYAALAFLCRYLGYSRAVTHEGAAFRAMTTREAINRYFDIESRKEEVKDTCREIVRVFGRAEDFFNVGGDDDELPMAFYRWKGRRKFEALQAITSMVCARVLDAAVREGQTTDAQVVDAVGRVVATQAYPEKQQYVTIWDYQARMVLSLAGELALDLDNLSNGKFAAFHARMVDARMKTLA
ncbi:MAG: DUF262 domain-containing protein [Longimicrobiales bacterium]